MPNYKPVEKYTQQVKQCVTIALKCVDPGMEKRPAAKDIIEELNALDQISDSQFEMHESTSYLSSQFASKAQIGPWSHAFIKA